MLSAQEGDPVLFSIGDQPVHRSEFEYIYQKTHNGEAPYTKASLEEYLDLYIRFKLKVQRALELGLDTVPALQQELDGYRRNLAETYLVDRDVLDRLVREVYDRKQQDVEISQILIAANPFTAPEDTLRALERAQAARQRVLTGEAFETVAREMSEDPRTAPNGGYIGFVTAMFPNGYYPLETAAYSQPLDSLSRPVRTTAGYHILKVSARRPARGQIEIAHLMLRDDPEDPDGVKARIDSLYTALQNGADFAVLARTHSQDASTRGNAGMIGTVGINRFETAFEDAAFALKADGDISEPVKTSLGWHIIKRLGRPGIQPFSSERYRIEEEIRNDRRFERARNAVVDRLKQEEGYSAHEDIHNAILDTVSSAFFQAGWKLHQMGTSDPQLFTLGDTSLHLSDLDAFLMLNLRQRQSLTGRADPAVALDFFMDAFEKQTALRYLNGKLEVKYPEFRYLMREYREGILLFEATQEEVWNSAALDSAGLENFFRENRDQYQWNTRAVCSEYRLSSQAGDQLESLRAYATGNDPAAVLDRFNTGANSIVARVEKTFEKGTAGDVLEEGDWKEGELSPTRRQEPNDTYVFYKVESVLPPQPKTLDEARGYVTADYQDQMEKQWVDDLRKKYEVVVHEDVLNDMIVQ